MKKFYLVLALSGIMQMGFGQAVDKSVDIPDLDNYQTLKCDFICIPCSPTDWYGRR